MLRLPLQHPPIARLRLLPAAQVQERVAEGVVGIHVIGVQLERAPAARRGLVRAPASEQRLAQFGVQLGVLGS